MMLLPRLLLVCVALLLAACTVTPEPPLETGHGTPLDIRKYFTGSTTSSGRVHGPLGKERERFTAVLEGRREADILHLDQRFTFASGRKLHRVWKIRRAESGHWDVTATGIPGPVEIEERRRSIHLRYPMNIDLGGAQHEVTFDQWMWLSDDRDGTLLNRATISKLGVKVATVSEEFRK